MVRAEGAVEVALAVLAHTSDALGQGLVVTDGCRIVQVNDAACAVLGRPRAWLESVTDLQRELPADERARIGKLLAMRAYLGLPPPRRYRLVVDRPDGGRVDLEVAVTPIEGSGLWAAVLRDVSDVTSLRHQALTDPLTGLGNRRLLVHRLTRLLDRPHPVALLLMIDLDRFKEVNDTHGHDTGDRVLMGVASRLRGALPEGAVICRIGGDEFVVIAEGAVCGDLARTVESALEPPHLIGSRTVPVGCSVGAIAVEGGDAGVDEVLAAVDRAMYIRKRERRTA